MKNKLLLSAIAIIFFTFAFFTNCSKEIDEMSPEEILATVISGGSGDVVENYVLFRSEQTVNSFSFDSSFEITANAIFKDGTNYKNAGNLVIATRQIPSLPNNFYDFTYSNGNFSEGKSLLGTTINMGVTGSAQVEAFSRTAYVPNQIITTNLQLPSSTVNRTQNLTLRWNPDPSSLWGKVVIQISYYTGLSQLSNPSLPNSIEPLLFTVTDNGAYTVSSTDLQRFPATAYIGISIGRGTENSITLPNTRRKVYYFTIVDAKTIPLLVTQ